MSMSGEDGVRCVCKMAFLSFCIGFLVAEVVKEYTTSEMRAECEQMREYLYTHGLMRYELDHGTGEIGLSFGENL